MNGPIVSPFDPFQNPLATPADVKVMKERLEDVRHGRYGSGNMDTNYPDALKADVIAMQQFPDMIEKMLMTNHDLEERLEERAFEEAALNQTTPTMGTQHKWKGTR